METIAQIERELEEAEQQARIHEQHTGQTDSAHHERAAALREKLKAAKKTTHSHLPDDSPVPRMTGDAHLNDRPMSVMWETKKEKES